MGPIDSSMKKEKKRANMEGREVPDNHEWLLVGESGIMGKAVRNCTGGVTMTASTTQLLP